MGIQKGNPKWEQDARIKSFKNVQCIGQELTLSNQGWTWWSRHSCSLLMVLSKCEADQRSIESRLNSLLAHKEFPTDEERALLML